MAGKDVKMAKDCIGDDVTKLVDSLKDGEVRKSLLVPSTS